METRQAPVNVYSESTPNPASMKFVADRLLVEDGSQHEFSTAAEAKASPLASALFCFPFVTKVFLATNFVTVSKDDTIAWEDIQHEMREYVRDYLREGKEVLTREAAAAPANGAPKQPAETAQPATEIEKRIVELLEEYIRPAVEMDGGAIHFKSFKDGVLTVSLRGACSGCPSSMVTLKGGIEGLFDRMLPEVKQVVAEEA